MCKKGENIFQRKDGRWEARYVKRRDESRKIIYGYVYGKSYKEAKESKKLKEQELNNVTVTVDKNKFNKVLDTFLNQKKITVKESTYMRYSEIINIYIKPNLGNINTCDITLDNALIIYNKYENTLSVKTLRDILILLNEILKFANLSFRVPYPKLKKKNIEILSDEKIRTLSNYLMSNMDNINLGILISLYTGIRIGELCALKWSDIDINNINITQSINRIKCTNEEHKTKVVITEPKTKSSIRNITVPSFILPYINDARGKEDEYLLSGTTKYIEPRLLRNKFNKLMKSLDIKVKFHALRHTFATKCLELGMDPKTLSEILGHANYNITMMTYVHPRDEHKSKIMRDLYF